MNRDDLQPFQPTDADKAAIEALVASNWNLDLVPRPFRPRAAKALSILRLAGHVQTDDQAAARLVDLALTRLDQATSSQTIALTPDDEEALDAWLLADHRHSRVPGSLRDRAAKIEAIGSLLTSVPAVSARSTSSLIDSTLARIDAENTAKSTRGPLPFDRAPTRRYKLSDLVSVAAMLTLATAVIWPIVASGRSNMQQIACRTNLGDVATGMGLYSGDNRGALPMATASLAGLPWWDVGVPERSNSANLFTLARTQYTKPQTLACGGNPFCRESEMTCDDKDWQSLPSVSYSFRIMFGGRNPTWRTPADVIVLSDKSPVVSRAVRGEVVFPAENSANHANRGQNVLCLDGSSRFMTTPITPSGDNIWLPRGIELALAQVARSLKPGQSGYVQIHGWVGPNRMEPIKGIETPADERDSFVGP
jgi:hypothetical protein